MRTRVKIYCIASTVEARLAVAHGADAIGLVGPMPSGPGVIDLADAAQIAMKSPPAISSFLLSSKLDLPSLISQIELVNPSTIQIVDAVDRTLYRSLRQRFPALKIVQVVHVEDKRSVDAALTVCSLVDGLLLDSGRPGAAIKALGGTGCTHDWHLSRQIVEQSGKPVFLAGGLRSDNVEEAINIVGPFGVDVCSGVRTGGYLNKGKLIAFMAAVRRADECRRSAIA